MHIYITHNIYRLIYIKHTLKNHFITCEYCFVNGLQRVEVYPLKEFPVPIFYLKGNTHFAIMILILLTNMNCIICFFYKTEGEIRATTGLKTTTEIMYTLTITASDGFLTSTSLNVSVIITGTDSNCFRHKTICL